MYYVTPWIVHEARTTLLTTPPCAFVLVYIHMCYDLVYVCMCV